MHACMHMAILHVHAYVETTGQLLVSIFIIFPSIFETRLFTEPQTSHFCWTVWPVSLWYPPFSVSDLPSTPHPCSVLTVKTYWYDFVLCESWRSKNQVFLFSQQALYILRHYLNPKSMQTLIWLSSLRTFYYAKLLYTSCSKASFSPYNCLAFCLKMDEPHWTRKTYSRGMMERLFKSKLRIWGDILIHLGGYYFRKA